MLRMEARQCIGHSAADIAAMRAETRIAKHIYHQMYPEVSDLRASERALRWPC